MVLLPAKCLGPRLQITAEKAINRWEFHLRSHIREVLIFSLARKAETFRVEHFILLNLKKKKKNVEEYTLSQEYRYVYKVRIIQGLKL